MKNSAEQPGQSDIVVVNKQNMDKRMPLFRYFIMKTVPERNQIH